MYLFETHCDYEQFSFEDTHTLLQLLLGGNKVFCEMDKTPRIRVMEAQ